MVNLILVNRLAHHRRKHWVWGQTCAVLETEMHDHLGEFMDPQTLPGRSFAVARALLAAVALASAASSSALTVVFADDFEDGNVGDWSKTAQFPDIASVFTSTSHHSGAFGLGVSINVSPSMPSSFASASRQFIAPVAGDYYLDLWVRTEEASMSSLMSAAMYTVRVDNRGIAARISSQSFRHMTFVLDNLLTGVHTLSLGVANTFPSFGDLSNWRGGRYSAFFDDVSIATTAQVPIPEPGTYGLLAPALCLLWISCRRRSRGRGRRAAGLRPAGSPLKFIQCASGPASRSPGRRRWRGGAASARRDRG